MRAHNGGNFIAFHSKQARPCHKYHLATGGYIALYLFEGSRKQPFGAIAFNRFAEFFANRYAISHSLPAIWQNIRNKAAVNKTVSAAIKAAEFFVKF